MTASQLNGATTVHSRRRGEGQGQPINEAEQNSTNGNREGQLQDAVRSENKSGSKEIYDACPTTLHYEFGGPIGAFLIATATPFMAFWMQLECGSDGCIVHPFKPYNWTSLSDPSLWSSLLDVRGILLYFAWYFFTVICWLVLPGQWIKGNALRNGQYLDYKMNAFATLIVTILGVGATTYVFGLEPLLYIADHMMSMSTGALLMSLLQSLYVYAASFSHGKMLALGGNSGHVIYDWFIGRELNPRIGIFDIKTFNEMRPGLILWVLIDLAYAAKQYASIGRVTDSMILVLAFHSWYVFDAEYNEACIMSQMDITTDGFGFMLSMGDLLWVPFTYSLQARYLAYTPKDLGLVGIVGVLVVQMTGYYIFRVSNAEKNDFRNGKNPRSLTSMPTERGTRLLTSGWWGRSRHPNYMGDWIMAWAWSLPTGFDTLMPYFYPVYFAVLLVHRQRRDDEACRIKYGNDWEKYTKLVSSRIIPGFY